MTDDCGRTKRDGSGEPCGLPAGWGTEHSGEGACKLHGGATTGAGAPENNGNAITHGVQADPFNLYRHLSPDERAWVNELVAGYIELLGYGADDPRIERVRRACIHIYQSWSAEDYILEAGLSEDTVVGVTDAGEPVIKQDGHHLHRFAVQRDKEARQILKDLGAYDDPQSEMADALRGVTAVFSEVPD